MGVESGLQVWRVADHVRKVAVFAAGFFLFLALVATAVGLLLAATALMWAVALLVIMCVWRWYLVPYVALSSEWVVVQGAFSHRAVRYGAIREARPGLYGLRIKTTSGAFVAWAVQKSKFADWFHRQTRADEVAAQIMQRVDHHPAAASLRMAHGTGPVVPAPSAAV
jgi:hypothetical protein